MGGFTVMSTMVDDLVPDELWAIVEPLLPLPPRAWYGGRRRTIPERNCFAAIVDMVRTSTPWRLLPATELGCGSPATCWRRLTEWAKAGVFDQLHLEVLDRLGVDGEVEWSRATVDTMSVRARRGRIMLAQIPSIVANPDQAPPGLRRQWPAADGRGDGGQRQRQHYVRDADKRRAGSAHPQRLAALPARRRPLGQGV
jgi:transposase